MESSSEQSSSEKPSSEEHLLTTFTMWKHNQVTTLQLVVKNESWKQTDLSDMLTGDHIHRFYFMEPSRYENKLQNGRNLFSSANWNILNMSISPVMSAMDDPKGRGVCFYCEIIKCNPSISLQEIQTALYDASGTFKERATAVYERFCHPGVTTKPAK